jgi:nucleotide-binding universal stress UspA family protein
LARFALGGDTLPATAGEHAARLLVMGAYSHSRLRG